MHDYSNYFVELYKNVLEKEKKKFNVKDTAIRNAIKVMKDAYFPDPSWRSKSVRDLGSTNYDDPAFRCAYLHKYAMCYTGMVCHLLQLALDQSREIFAYFQDRKKVNICSLGGGPGTDIVGVLAALASRNLDNGSWSATIIDLAGNWKTTYFSLLSELQNGNCSCLRRVTRKMSPFVNYLRTDLLGSWDSEPLAEQSVKTADVVLMVKFVSAAACNFYTERMIKKVFYCLKPGAMVVFIDNAAGGFNKMVKQNSLDVGLAGMYGPLLHYDYENPKFDVCRFGSKSQSKSRVAFEVYKKPRHSVCNFQSGYAHSRKIGMQSKISYLPENNDPGQAFTRYYGNRQFTTPEQQNDHLTFFEFILLIAFLCFCLYLLVAKNK